MLLMTQDIKIKNVVVIWASKIKQASDQKDANVSMTAWKQCMGTGHVGRHHLWVPTEQLVLHIEEKFSNDRLNILMIC